MSSTPTGSEDQTRTRNTLRITGVGLIVVALYLFGSGVADFATSANNTGTHGPSTFGALFLGLLLFAPAGWCLQAGFMRGSRPTAPVAPAPTMAVLPTEPGAVRPASASPPLVQAATQPAVGPATGLACGRCEARSHEMARFCERCGAPLAG